MQKKVDCRWGRRPTAGGDNSQNYSKLLHQQTLLPVRNVRSCVWARVTVGLLIINYNCKFIHIIPRNLSRAVGLHRRPSLLATCSWSMGNETSLLQSDKPQCIIPSFLPLTLS